MLCKTCGREISNENANFCEYCGASFRENSQAANDTAAINRQPDSNIITNAENEKSISFANWLGSMMLPFIPLIGPFIYMIMLFVWSLGSEVPKSKKNWARATLLIILIAIIVMTIFISSFIADFMNSGMTMEEFMNDYMNQYMNQYY